MALSSSSGGSITLVQAQELIKNFKATYPGEIKGSFIGSDNVNLILRQTGCIGIRIYHGYDIAQKSISLILVGVDSNEKDMTTGYIMDRMVPCPLTCDTGSSLFI